MSDYKNDIKAKQTISGNDNNQIAVQNNYTGLSASDAFQIALDIFKEYYPKLQEEAMSELRKIVDREMECVKPINIKSPEAKIAKPVLENASITEEHELRCLYAKLLASAMDKGSEDSIHPAFVSVINQMNSYDAKVLKRIVDISNSIPVGKVRFTFDNKYLTEALPRYFSTYFEDFDDMYKVSFSLENLSRLELIDLFEGNVITYNYDNITDSAYVRERFEHAKKMNLEIDLNIEKTDFVIQINDFGKRFIKTCMPKEL